MNIPAVDDEDRECVVVGFTGGDYNQYAIVHYGAGRFWSLPLDNVSLRPRDETPPIFGFADDLMDPLTRGRA